MLYVIMSTFVILGFLFWFGKGDSLIAGYNTATQEQKSRYHTKRLRHCMGIAMWLIAGLITVSHMLINVVKEAYGILLFCGIIVVVVGLLVLTGTYCRLREGEEQEYKEMTDRERFHQTLVTLAAVFLIFALFIISLVIPDKIGYTFTDNAITIQCTEWPNQSLAYRDIEKVSYLESLDTGNRTNGYSSFYVLEGQFSNHSFGKYHLYAYKKCNAYVVINTKKGIVVINDVNPEQTKKLYDTLLQKK